MREQFELWFKTTKANELLEEMNYFKKDLFHFVDARNAYRHSSVQIAFMTWKARQAEVDAKDARIKELEYFNENQYKAINQRDLEFKKLRDLICKMLEDEHTYMRPSMAHECIVATGWRNDPE